MVTPFNITFNLFAQTSQLAARINLGSPQVWDTETRGIERKRSTVDRGKSGDEKGRTDRATTRRKRGELRSRDEKQSADHVGDGSRSVARAGNRSLRDGSQCDESGETDSQSQELRLRGRRLILHSHPPSRRGPSRCRFCCCRCCLDDGMIGWTGCHHPLLFSFLHSHLLCHAGSTCPPVTSTFLVPVDERSLALSFSTFIRVN